MMIRSAFTPSELDLPYDRWCQLLGDQPFADLSPDDRVWLGDWRHLDLALSPMPDDRRRVLRAGHHAGWFARATVAEGVVQVEIHVPSADHSQSVELIGGDVWTWTINSLRVWHATPEGQRDILLAEFASAVVLWVGIPRPRELGE